LADYDEQELNEVDEVDEDCYWLRADQFDVPAIRAAQRAEFPAQFDNESWNALIRKSVSGPLLNP
jgi:hypothetical protein